MSNIYSVKFMNEASTTLESKVFKKPVRETYLFSTIKALTEMNSIIDNNTKNLYIQISEAESKQDENKIFAEYFYQFKTIFKEFANRIEAMQNRMIISVENKLDVWKDLTKEDYDLFDQEFNFSGYKFSHMDESDYPRLNLHKYYQKEFDYIGRLMQDTSINATPSAKLKVIASVSNNFTNYAGDKGWIKDVIKDMVDIDEKEINGSYSECVYNSLRDKAEIVVNRGVLYTCKENLCNCEDYINAAVALCRNLLHELDKIAEDISSFLFRNQDNKLVIKTDTDGVIDRTYRLDTYSMNQLDLFMKSKISQIKKLLNIYAIAIGIKLDTVIDCIDQNIEILQMASNGSEISSEVEDDETEDEDNENDNSEEFDGDSDDNHDDEDHMDDDDFEFGNSDDDEDDQEPIEEEDPDDYDIDFGDADNEPDEEYDKVVIDKDTEDFNEAYLFEAELFELDMLYQENRMYQSISEALLLETTSADRLKIANGGGQNGGGQNGGGQNGGGQNGGGQNGGGQNGGDKVTQSGENGDKTTDNKSKSNLNKLSNQKKDPKGIMKFIQNIINKCKELWEKFLSKFDDTKDKIAWLKRNSDYIKKPLNEKVGLKYTPKFDLIEKLDIPDLNYGTMKALFESEETFLGSEHFIKFFSKEDSNKKDFTIENLKNNLLGEEQELQKIEYGFPGNGTIKGTQIQDAYDYCLKFEQITNTTKRMLDKLKRAESVANRDLDKVQESANINTYSRYFNEMETEKDSDKDDVDERTEKRNNVDTYFKVCSKVMSTKMTVSKEAFNEMYQFCKYYITQVKAKNGDNKTEENTETPAEETTK